jgi:hypothetical protein
MSTRECDGPETGACRWSFEYEQIERENRELLEALKNLIAWHDADHNASREAIDWARDVIAKAEGK